MQNSRASRHRFPLHRKILEGECEKTGENSQHRSVLFTMRRAAYDRIPIYYLLYLLPSTRTLSAYIYGEQGEQKCAPCRGERLDVCMYVHWLSLQTRYTIQPRNLSMNPLPVVPNWST